MRMLLKTCGFAVIIWFLLCCLFPDEALGSRSAFTRESPSAIEQSTAHAYCTPESVAIGEPFTLFLDILHDSKLRVLLDAPDAGAAEDQFGPSWVVLEPRRVTHLPLNDGTGRSLTQVRWELFGVEPGTLEIPVIGADALTSGTVQRVESSVATIIVQPELAEGEDAARPLAGFQPPPEVGESPLGTLGLILFGSIAAVLLLLGALLIRWAMWRRSAPQRAPQPTALAELAKLDPSDDENVRDLHYSLAELTRMSLDAARQSRNAGQTDEEWVADLRRAERFPEGLILRAEQLLTKCAEVKYGASKPTRWAATEAWEEARAICQEAGAVASSNQTQPNSAPKTEEVPA